MRPIPEIKADMRQAEDEGRTSDAIKYVRELSATEAETNQYWNTLSFERKQEICQAEKNGELPKYKINDSVYDRFGMAWEISSISIFKIDGKSRVLYKLGHFGTRDYNALYADEVFDTPEAAQAALGGVVDE